METTKKRILHIEDDEDTKLMVKTLLEKHGYCVSNGVNESECLSILNKEDIDLVLLDVMLPDTNGWKIFKRIRENPENNDVKVAFLSIIPASQDRLEILKREGGGEYITKPFKNKDLLGRIDKVLG